VTPLDKPQVWLEDVRRQQNGQSPLLVGRRYLGEWGSVAGLRYSSTFPGGSRSLRCLFTAAPTRNPVPQHYRRGMRCGVSVGTVDVWSGHLLEAPRRHGAVELRADGDAVHADKVLAWASGGQEQNPYNLASVGANIVGNAGSWPSLFDWQQPDGGWPSSPALQAANAADEPNGTVTFAAAMSQVGSYVGKAWWVSPDRKVFWHPITGFGPTLTAHLGDRPALSIADVATIY
jgi:hypothetical protein